MALSVSQTRALVPLLKPGIKIASMGYPDMIAPEGMIINLVGAHQALYEYRQDSEAICNRHGLAVRQIPDAKSVFESAGCKLHVFDIVKERGEEILCDLNLPFSYYRHNLETYDIVLDVGTVEHCFNIAQAIMNMASLLKEGGHIIHENPFNWGNHGFYNLNPTFFADFYAANGFDVLRLDLTTRDGHCVTPPPTSRFIAPDGEFNIFCHARRTKLVKQLTYPTQTKYAKLIKPDAVERAA